MTNIGDTVRVIDGTKVVEGRVTGLFGVGGIEYVQVGEKIYTIGEVTKVPDNAPLLTEPVSDKALTPATEDYDVELDDRDDEIKALVNDKLSDDLTDAISDAVIAFNRLIALLTEEDDVDAE